MLRRDKDEEEKEMIRPQRPRVVSLTRDRGATAVTLIQKGFPYTSSVYKHWNYVWCRLS
jgi:hypothetical protein